MTRKLAQKLKRLFVLAVTRIEDLDSRIPTWLKASVIVAILIVIAGAFTYFVRHNSLSVLQPEGLIARRQLQLLVFAGLLSLIVVIPVFFMTFYFAWKYRETNTKATYKPDDDHSRTAEAIWWGVPLILIIILSVVTWTSSHSLDPFRPIDSTEKPLTIQVVALQWKWLFIYPDQQVATVNYVNIPEKTPVNFQITSDAPMNSFWVPKLGGQVYAMSGMSTELHLLADNTGVYPGVSANISGEGFSSMNFDVTAMTQADFEAWAKTAPQTYAALNMASYNELAKPSLNNPPTTYRLAFGGLYNEVVMKYMNPNMHDSTSEHSQEHVDYSQPGAAR